MGSQKSTRICEAKKSKTSCIGIGFPSIERVMHVESKRKLSRESLR